MKEKIEPVCISYKEDTSEIKKTHKRDRVKKKKGIKDIEADIKNGAREGEITVSYGEHGREKKEKNKKDGNEVGTHKQNNNIHAMEMVERKKEQKMSKDENWYQDSLNEAKNDEVDLSSLQQENVPDNVEGTIQSINHVGNAMKEHGRKKKKKMKEKFKYDLSAAQQDSGDKDISGPAHTDKSQINGVEYVNTKKNKLVENGSGIIQDNQVEYASKGKKRKTKSVENGPNDPTPIKTNKKVRFSGEVEVFPVPIDSNTEKGNDEEDNLVRGKRFTHEEDEIVKDAVTKYIEEHDLRDEGLNMVLNCRKYPEVKGCWKEIGLSIPYRPYTAIYYRAQILFRRSENRKWTQEEYDQILKYQEEHGNEWKVLADGLGKHRFHVKDTWRRIKLRNMKTGHWSQEEYQKLFDLVNTDLQMKVSEEKRSKHGMLRDNICWTAISDELSTRAQGTCCLKWYKQLTSHMVAEGVWADTDDYRLLDSLYSLDATCMEDVDWDNLVEDRPGDACRKRWNQMSLHIGCHGHKSFAEQVEVLAQRYCPHLLEAREAWDSKPRVP